MKEIFPKMYKETFDSQQSAKREKPAHVIFVDHKCRIYRIILPSGHSDNVSLFLKEDTLYCLSYNLHYDYVGLTVWNLTEIEDNTPPGKPQRYVATQQNEIFCQGEEHYREILGPEGLDLLPRTMTDKLLQYV